MTDFVKRNPDAPPGFFACEAAGLRWLTAADGAACTPVIDCDATSLTLEHLDSAAPSRRAAAGFGARLAVTHDAGAAGFGAWPDGWDGPGFFGPLQNPLPMSLATHPTWGEFYADERLGPMGSAPPRGSPPQDARPSRRFAICVARAGSTTVTHRRTCTVICGAET